MNLLNLLNYLVLSADLEYEVVPPTEYIRMKGSGTADTLYKGSIIMASPSGYGIVAADGAQASLLFTVGLCVKQVSIAGSNAENFEVETGRIWMAKADAAQTNVGQLFYASDDATIASGTSGIGPLGMCVDFKTGYLLIDTRLRAKV